MMKMILGAALALGLMTAPLMAQESDGMACDAAAPTYEDTVKLIENDTMPGKYIVLEGDALKVFVDGVEAVFGDVAPDEYVEQAKVVIPMTADEGGNHAIMNFRADTGCGMAAGNGLVPMFFVAAGLDALTAQGVEAPEIE